MTKDPFVHFVKDVTNLRDELEELLITVAYWEALQNPSPERDVQDDVSLKSGLVTVHMWGDWLLREMNLRRELSCVYRQIDDCILSMTTLYCQDLTSLISKEEKKPCIGGRRVAEAIVVSTVVLLTFVYQCLLGFIGRDGSKAGSSGPLDVRDIYISIDLFQAAYVWIKSRDVIPSIPKGAVYRRKGSKKWEPRIIYPMMKGVGGRSEKIYLRSYNSFAEAEYVYKIAAFYCKKHTYRLDLGGGAYFSIPTMSMDARLPYDEQVNQVRDQVLKVYAEFQEQKASRNLPPCVPGLPLETLTGEGELLTTSSFQECQQPLNSGMDSAMQGWGPLDPTYTMESISTTDLD